MWYAEAEQDGGFTMWYDEGEQDGGFTMWYDEEKQDGGFTMWYAEGEQDGGFTMWYAKVEQDDGFTMRGNWSLSCLMRVPVSTTTNLCGWGSSGSTGYCDTITATTDPHH